MSFLDAKTGPSATQMPSEATSTGCVVAESTTCTIKTDVETVDPGAGTESSVVDATQDSAQDSSAQDSTQASDTQQTVRE
jgi:hypothetical protein